MGSIITSVALTNEQLESKFIEDLTNLPINPVDVHFIESSESLITILKIYSQMKDMSFILREFSMENFKQLSRQWIFSRNNLLAWINRFSQYIVLANVELYYSAFEYILREETNLVDIYQEITKTSGPPTLKSLECIKETKSKPYKPQFIFKDYQTFLKDTIDKCRIKGVNIPEKYIELSEQKTIDSCDSLKTEMKRRCNLRPITGYYKCSGFN